MLLYFFTSDSEGVTRMCEKMLKIVTGLKCELLMFPFYILDLEGVEESVEKYLE